jgi:hypothetical protein
MKKIFVLLVFFIGISCFADSSDFEGIWGSEVNYEPNSGVSNYLVIDKMDSYYFILKVDEKRPRVNKIFGQYTNEGIECSLENEVTISINKDYVDDAIIVETRIKGSSDVISNRYFKVSEEYDM